MSDLFGDKQQQANFARKMWYVLIPIFLLIVLFRVYNWSNGKDNLSGILSPFGLIFVGLATIVEPRNKPLSYVFIALGMIAVVSGLVLMILY